MDKYIYIHFQYKEGTLGLTKKILVCVTQQKTCERLIKHAASMKAEYGGELHVIHVAKNEWNFLDNKREGEALEYLFGISKSAGANLSVLKSDDIAESIADYAKQNGINYIVMGQSPTDHKENRFYNRLKHLLDEIEIEIVP